MIHHPIARTGFNLAATVKAEGRVRRKRITLRAIKPTNAQAQNLAAITLKVPQFWADAVDAIIAQYDPPAAPGRRDSVFGLGDVLERLRIEVERLVISLTPDLRDFAVRLETWHRGQWTGSVATATGVQLGTILTGGDVNESIESFVQRNVALIRDISDEARGRISDIVFRGFQARAPIEDVAREVRGAVDMSRRRAIRVAADQTQKLSAALDTERMQQAGLDRWEWLHSGKLHYRPQHLARNGHVYSFDDPPPDMPGQLPFCGCKKRGVIDLD
jgi:SPP1 gp7 family putative phage head morphogenesis protein